MNIKTLEWMKKPTGDFDIKSIAEHDKASSQLFMLHQTTQHLDIMFLEDYFLILAANEI